MKTISRKKNTPGKAAGFATLNKSTIVRQAKRAGRMAAIRAMHIMGFVVTVEDGWVVRKYKDGQIERISKISH
jgi:hypothetical protein